MSDVRSIPATAPAQEAHNAPSGLPGATTAVVQVTPSLLALGWLNILVVADSEEDAQRALDDLRRAYADAVATPPARSKSGRWLAMGRVR